MNTFPLHALIALCTTTSTYAQEETATLICMAVGFATAGAPNSSATARTTGPFPGRRTCSLLKPNSRSSISTRSDAAPRTINASTAGVASTVATKVHLDNLDRVLFKPPLPPTGSRDQHPASDHDHQTSRPPSDDRRAGADHFGEGQGRLMNTGRLRFIPPIALLRKQEAADEIMSPRSLNHLQHLLSKSPRPSPRSNIASRWRLLHGANAWAGLLDPLDEDLRRELVRYGDLVQAAYHAFHSLPSTPSSPSTRHRHLILPDRSYRATKSLFATSSLDFSSLAGPASLPGWLTQRSSWIGYVAVCENEREVRRMGRRDIVIVLRGTSTCLEWAENFRASLVPLDQSDDQRRAPHVPMVARGFRSLYKTPGERVPSLSSAVVDEVRRLMELYKGEELSITLTGHSLGAALAVLLADELSECCGGQDAPPISVVSFGGPRVGNRAFTERIEARGVNVLRVVNEHDVVTRVPALPRVAGGYEHVGAEMRVDNRCSPYLIPDADPACCHDLEAYLHLVDGFAGTGCPFRSDAKRSLSRLLDLQESNVKAVYRRARTHGLINPVGVHVPVRSDERGCLPSPSSLIN